MLRDYEKPPADTNPQVLALRALAWMLGDAARAQRLLDVTGLTPADLRARAGEAEVLAAALGFLQAHQPDLLACAAALEVTPERLVAAQERLA